MKTVNRSSARNWPQPLLCFWIATWVLVTILGLVLSQTAALQGWQHEFVLGGVLNVLLILSTGLCYFFCSDLNARRTLVMCLWFVHFEFVSPIVVIAGWILSTYGWETEFVFYFIFLNLFIPVFALIYFTGISINKFLYTCLIVLRSSCPRE
jgi:hypothetical protein